MQENHDKETLEKLYTCDLSKNFFEAATKEKPNKPNKENPNM